jgi:D-ribose pyranose/furanose isomerase RbsD
METLIVRSNSKDIHLLKELLKKMKITYIVESEQIDSYNKEFTDKLDKSIQEAQEGKIQFIKTEDLWK